MAQNTKIQKTQKTQTHVFVQNRKREKEMEIFAFCVLCHKFGTNHNLDLLSTSK